MLKGVVTIYGEEETHPPVFDSLPLGKKYVGDLSLLPSLVPLWYLICILFPLSVSAGFLLLPSLSEWAIDSPLAYPSIAGVLGARAYSVQPMSAEPYTCWR